MVRYERAKSTQRAWRVTYRSQESVVRCTRERQ